MREVFLHAGGPDKKRIRFRRRKGAKQAVVGHSQARRFIPHLGPVDKEHQAPVGRSFAPADRHARRGAAQEKNERVNFTAVIPECPFGDSF